MDLIGDCRLKGATRVIEDLEHADPRQHPRNLLPGDPFVSLGSYPLEIEDTLSLCRSLTTGGERCDGLCCLATILCKAALTQCLHNGP